MSNGAHRIGILGAGNVGSALGKLWMKQHEVTFGVPNPDKSKASLPGDAKVKSNRDAAAEADVVVLTVPWPAAEEAVRSAGPLDGKIVIDCTNPVSSDLKSLVIGTNTSAGEMVQQWATGARVVKAFNTIGAVNYGNAQFGSQRADGFYCGDDAKSKQAVKPLIEEAGLEPVDVGPLSNARALEAMALLWIDMAVLQGQGPNHAFKLLRR
jgi:predicted dinucleotide-binding enzyme